MTEPVHHKNFSEVPPQSELPKVKEKGGDQRDQRTHSVFVHTARFDAQPQQERDPSRRKRVATVLPQQQSERQEAGRNQGDQRAHSVFALVTQFNALSKQKRNPHKLVDPEKRARVTSILQKRRGDSGSDAVTGATSGGLPIPLFGMERSSPMQQQEGDGDRSHKRISRHRKDPSLRSTDTGSSLEGRESETRQLVIDTDPYFQDEKLFAEMLRYGSLKNSDSMRRSGIFRQFRAVQTLMDTSLVSLTVAVQRCLGWNVLRRLYPECTDEERVEFLNEAFAAMRPPDDV